MILRNVGGQPLLLPPLLATADGAAQTAGAAIAVRKDGVDVGAPAGTLVHVTGGVWQYTPTAGESDCGILAMILTKAASVPVASNVVTTRLPVQTAGVLPAVVAGAATGLPVLDGAGNLVASLAAGAEAGLTAAAQTAVAAAVLAAAAADPIDGNLVTFNGQPVSDYDGLLQAGAAAAATQVLLAADESDQDDVLNGAVLELIEGSARQIVTVTDYVGATRTAILSPALAFAVTTGTGYTVLGAVPDKFGYGLSATERTALAAAVFGFVLENGKTFAQFARAWTAVLKNTALGLSSPTTTFRDDADLLDRLVTSQTGDNRTITSVNLD